MNNIWQNLKESKQPFCVLAPMDDVTDTVFRQIVAKHAPADLMMTEFANADGYCSPGKEAIKTRLRLSPSEGPVIAQIWGINPDNYYIMARDLVDMGFAGIDINMGCPVKDMIKKGACSAMIQNHALAAEAIAATIKGVKGQIPVSVKTRIGFNTIDTENWIGFLLQQKLDAITVHSRTKKEMSKVPAHWDEVAKAVTLRDKIAPKTVIIGNGDVLTRQEAMARTKQTGVDGIMMGRGIFYNLFIFDENQKEHSLAEMLGILMEHIMLYQKTWGDSKTFEPLKKFFKLYINGFDGSASIRALLMDTKSAQEALEIIGIILKTG
ncbi:tRNA-dihydrouridine synthase [Candidatus Saccharibacteria bacterium]|nr:tRNA-dihydrouridine synthase [Candidatus Saccharibacteria bacterium]